MISHVIDKREPFVRRGSFIAARFQHACAKAAGGNLLGPGNRGIVDEVSSFVEVIDAGLDVYSPEVVEVLDFENNRFALNFGEIQTRDKATTVHNER